MPRTSRPKPQPHRGKWRVRWIDALGKRCSETHDEYDDAQFALDRHLLQVQEVKRGLRALSVPTKTFNELCDHWLATRAKRKRSEADDKSIIKCHLRPFFGRCKLQNVGLRVDDFIESREELKEKTVNNLLTLLIAMLNEARDKGWLRDMPKIRKFKLSILDKDYRWLRTQGEIARFLGAAAEEKNPMVHVLYATAIYTGMRAGELAGLRWDHVDFERRLITVEFSYSSKRTKGGEIRHVPILDPLLPVLRAWRLKMPGELLFPTSVGTLRQESDRIFQDALHRVLDRAGFQKSTLPCGRIQRYIVFHSLRHTFASHWVLGGGDIFKLQKILGHKDIKMTMRYAHLAPNAFEGDFGRLGGVVPGGGAVVRLGNAVPTSCKNGGENLQETGGQAL